LLLLNIFPMMRFVALTAILVVLASARRPAHRDCIVLHDDNQPDRQVRATWPQDTLQSVFLLRPISSSAAAFKRIETKALRRQYLGVFLHHVDVDGLEPSTTYQYRCGESGHVSTFTTAHPKKPEPIPVYPSQFIDFPDNFPQQVHLSYGADGTSEMVVTFSTMAPGTASQVSFWPFGQPQLAQTVNGASTKFVDGGTGHHTQYIHRVSLTGLTPKQRYTYTAGDEQVAMSTEFSFKTMSDESGWAPRLAVYGDFGLFNDRSIPLLQHEVNTSNIDAILHIGDFAYDLYNENGTRGDVWLNSVQSIYANVPVMTVPGNHERAYNFSNYKNRFTMPMREDNDNFWYSFDMGPIHFVGISTESYMYPDQIEALVFQRQFEWLKADLAQANANRKNVPWIVTFGHRPMYCAPNDHDHDDCHSIRSVIRDGFHGIDGMEKLFFDNGVDLSLWAHVHSYERLWPTYQFENKNGSLAAPYVNPRATVHLITGAAGCQEKIDHWQNVTESWSAFKSEKYGFGLLTGLDHSHLHFQQLDYKTGETDDEFTIIRSTPQGPFSQSQ